MIASSYAAAASNYGPWRDIVAKAKAEGVVNFSYWGGNVLLNHWLNSEIKSAMAAQGIKLVLKPVGDTSSIVELIHQSYQSLPGIANGPVDVLWVNGENFQTLNELGLLYGSFFAHLLNKKNFVLDPKTPAGHLNLYDFSVPTNFTEAPFSREQYVCTYHTDMIPNMHDIRNFADFKAFLEAHPGKFTYTRPPNFDGTTFVESVLIAHVPDHLKPLLSQSLHQRSSKVLAEMFAPGIAYLKEIAPLLYKIGDKPLYPRDLSVLNQLLKTKKIWIGCRFGLYSLQALQALGKMPDTLAIAAFPESGIITNKSFLTVPINATHPHSAFVLINHLLSLEVQLQLPKRAGMAIGIDQQTLSKKDAQLLKLYAGNFPGTSAQELSSYAIADGHASFFAHFPELWERTVLNPDEKPLIEVIHDVFFQH